MTELEGAYVAGILDGEGYLFFANPGHGRGRSRPQMEVVSTDPELIEWLKETCGGYCPKTLPAKGQRKAQHRWRANGRTAQQIARVAAPYMRINRKREIAESFTRW